MKALLVVLTAPTIATLKLKAEKVVFAHQRLSVSRGEWRWHGKRGRPVHPKFVGGNVDAVATAAADPSLLKDPVKLLLERRAQLEAGYTHAEACADSRQTAPQYWRQVRANHLVKQIAMACSVHACPLPAVASCRSGSAPTRTRS